MTLAQVVYKEWKQLFDDYMAETVVDIKKQKRDNAKQLKIILDLVEYKEKVILNNCADAILKKPVEVQLLTDKQYFQLKKEWEEKLNIRLFEPLEDEYNKQIKIWKSELLKQKYSEDRIQKELKLLGVDTYQNYVKKQNSNSYDKDFYKEVIDCKITGKNMNKKCEEYWRAVLKNNNKPFADEFDIINLIGYIIDIISLATK